MATKKSSKVDQKLNNSMKQRPIASRINLTLDEDFRFILSDIRSHYPLLKEVDLIKMAVSGYYTENFVEELDEETSRNVEKSRQEFREGKYKTFSSVDELMKDLNS